MSLSPPEVFAAARTLLADSITPEVARALHDAEVRPILLKGPALARWLYGDDTRTYSDTDLLVDPGRWEQAESVLSDLGFEPAQLYQLWSTPNWHAQPWIRWDSGNVDLHRTLAGVGVPPGELWQVLSERTETINVGGVEVETLDPPSSALQVALHTVQDGKPSSKRDLPRALARVPTAVWEEAAALAARLEAVPAFAAGLRSVPAGKTLAAHLRLPDERSLEVKLRASAAPAMALTFDWLVNTPGIRPKLAFGVRKLIPPKAFILAWTPLARHGPLGLVAAYMWRLLRGCRSVAPALWAWSRARRELV